jgi:hypothetical protein
MQDFRAIQCRKMGKREGQNISSPFWTTTSITCTWVYPLRTKDQVYNRFREWKAEVETWTGKKVKTLRTDNGGALPMSFSAPQVRHEHPTHARAKWSCWWVPWVRLIPST